MAASSGVRCATVLVAASTFLNNDAIVAEESAARPRLLPARERKSRRVRTLSIFANSLRRDKPALRGRRSITNYEGRRRKGKALRNAEFDERRRSAARGRMSGAERSVPLTIGENRFCAEAVLAR